MFGLAPVEIALLLFIDSLLIGGVVYGIVRFVRGRRARCQKCGAGLKAERPMEYRGNPLVRRQNALAASRRPARRSDGTPLPPTRWR
jgi:hypothetical protein